MNQESNPIDLDKLKSLIHAGVQTIQSGVTDNQAILFVGDTGVGKSTLMSFLANKKLIVKFDGIKAYIDCQEQNTIKIGHQKYSETSIPHKVTIDGMVFYDCPGFKDNKGEQYQISNSFFIQRLFDVYGKLKIVIVVDESHISQERADKLPKLIHNMHVAFQHFHDIQDGCCIIINKADPDSNETDYANQLLEMVSLKNQNGHPLFQEEEANFLKYIVEQKRLLLFKKAERNEENKKISTTKSGNKILQCIKSLSFTKSHHIHNIISESAKLSIHDFIDQIEEESGAKIEIVCTHIFDTFSARIHEIGRNIDEIISLKEQIAKLIEQIKMAQKLEIVQILQREIPKEDLLDFQQDFASVMFFKKIYDKTQVYLNNLISKIQSELSYLMMKVDKRITVIQQQRKQMQAKQEQILQQKIKEQEKEQMRIKLSQYCIGLDNIVINSKQSCHEKINEISSLKNNIRGLNIFQEELRKIKIELSNLSNQRKSLSSHLQSFQVGQ